MEIFHVITDTRRNWRHSTSMTILRQMCVDWKEECVSTHNSTCIYKRDKEAAGADVKTIYRGPLWRDATGVTMDIMLTTRKEGCGGNYATWKTVIMAQSSESKFLRPHFTSSLIFSQNLQPKRFIPSILHTDGWERETKWMTSLGKYDIRLNFLQSSSSWAELK